MVVLVLPVEVFYLGVLVEGGFEDVVDFGEGLGAGAFAAGHEDGLGVGSADEAPAMGEVDADAVDVGDGIVPAEVMLELLYHLEFILVGTGDAGFGGAMVTGDGGQVGGEGFLAVGKDAKEAAGGVEGVVVAVVFVGEEHVAGHFAGEDGANFAHASFDKGMAGAGEFGLAAEAFYFVDEGLGAFHFHQGGGAGVLG